jgi:hypothetical protein
VCRPRLCWFRVYRAIQIVDRLDLVAQFLEAATGSAVRYACVSSYVPFPGFLAACRGRGVLLTRDGVQVVLMGWDYSGPTIDRVPDGSWRMSVDGRPRGIRLSTVFPLILVIGQFGCQWAPHVKR